MEVVKVNLLHRLILMTIVLGVCSVILVIIDFNSSLLDSLQVVAVAYIFCFFIIVKSHLQSSLSGLCFSDDGIAIVRNSTYSIIPWSQVSLEHKKFIFFNLPRFINIKNEEVLVTFWWSYYKRSSMIDLTNKCSHQNVSLRDSILQSTR
jgi:hypothetical protein